jgi:hypothetical protein
MADRAEVAGLTLPRPPAIATKTRTIFGGHFGDRNTLAVNKGERNGLSQQKTQNGGENQKNCRGEKTQQQPKIKIKNKCDWRENKNSFQRPVHR